MFSASFPFPIEMLKMYVFEKYLVAESFKNKTPLQTTEGGGGRGWRLVGGRGWRLVGGRGG